MSDGPFIETKEQVAGDLLVEAEGRDEAIAIAGRVPDGRIGTLSVRPLRAISGLPRTK